MDKKRNEKLTTLIVKVYLDEVYVFAMNLHSLLKYKCQVPVPTI